MSKHPESVTTGKLELNFAGLVSIKVPTDEIVQTEAVAYRKDQRFMLTYSAFEVILSKLVAGGEATLLYFD